MAGTSEAAEALLRELCGATHDHAGTRSAPGTGRTPRAPSRGTGRTSACWTPPPLLRTRSAGKPITEKIAVYREADTIAALEALRARIRPGVRELDRERSRARPRGRFLLVLAPARQFPLGGQSLVLRGLNLRARSR